MVVEQRIGRSLDDELALLWVLNLSDGAYSLLDIAERAGCRFDTMADLVISGKCYENERQSV